MQRVILLRRKNPTTEKKKESRSKSRPQKTRAHSESDRNAFTIAGVVGESVSQCRLFLPLEWRHLEQLERWHCTSRRRGSLRETVTISLYGLRSERILIDFG